MTRGRARRALRALQLFKNFKPQPRALFNLFLHTLFLFNLFLHIFLHSLSLVLSCQQLWQGRMRRWRQ